MSFKSQKMWHVQIFVSVYVCVCERERARERERELRLVTKKVVELVFRFSGSHLFVS